MIHEPVGSKVKRVPQNHHQSLLSGRPALSELATLDPPFRPLDSGWGGRPNVTMAESHESHPMRHGSIIAQVF